MSSIRMGFVGLGDIGLPMARSLAKKGLPLTIYARRKEVVEEMKSLGATAASSCREMAEASDVIISMVRDIPQTEEVIFGKEGVWEGIKKGATIVISSTIGSEYCRQLYARAKNQGIQVIDATLSKSGPINEEGKFTLMVGGDDEAVKRCWPVFEVMAKHIFHLGGIGMGQAYKLVNQLAGFGNTAVLRECLNVGLKAGLDLQKMLEVMRVSTGGSWMMMSMEHRIKSPKEGPAAQARRRGVSARSRELGMELGEKVRANMPLLRFIVGLDAESAYDAYSALMKQFN